MRIASQMSWYLRNDLLQNLILFSGVSMPTDRLAAKKDSSHHNNK